MKCLVFDLWGEYGHFRKFYTTSSPLTFAVPTRTAICGIIGALIGLDKEEYLSEFSKKKAKIAIKINKPIKKTRVSYNFINTKSIINKRFIKDRTQVTVELLKDPSFRIYISHEDENIYNKIKEFLIEGKNYYTLSLGLSEFIAEFKFVKEIEDLEFKKNKESNYIDIQTIIPFKEDINIDIENEKEYFKDNMPNEMDKDRIVTEYMKVLFERNGNTIRCGLPYYYSKKDGDQIVFL